LKITRLQPTPILFHIFPNPQTIACKTQHIFFQ
jgi:hypothetical protein